MNTTSVTPNRRSAWIFVLGTVLLLTSAGGCACAGNYTDAECGLPGEWRLIEVNGTTGDYGRLLVYNDLSGGRLEIAVNDSVTAYSGFGGGYFGADKRLSMWVTALYVHKGTEAERSGVHSFEFDMDAFTESSFTMRCAEARHLSGDTLITGPLLASSTWRLERVR
ncbi:MAG: hypothetical protein SF053_12480 [Bacteroidia bacterium]|jgi:hypothetical protein|nr:hypothetical protein [Bacteroidia bacterium]